MKHNIGALKCDCLLWRKTSTKCDVFTFCRCHPDHAESLMWSFNWTKVTICASRTDIKTWYGLVVAHYSSTTFTLLITFVSKNICCFHYHILKDPTDTDLFPRLILFNQSWCTYRNDFTQKINYLQSSTAHLGHRKYTHTHTQT